MRKFLFLLVSILFVFNAGAQNLPPLFEECLEDMYVEGSESSMEQMMQWYESLLLEPLNINSATRSQLESLSVLSLFQIESLLEYIQEYGGIISYSEFEYVDGFNPDIVAFLRPFISLSSVQASEQAVSQIRTKVKWKSSQEGFLRYARYLGSVSDFSYGLTLESDAAEPWIPDFISSHLSYQKKNFKALLGDFSATYGQGLAIGSSFSLSALGAPAAVLKRKDDFKPFTSAGENDAFRGLALSYSFGSHSQLQSFFSASSLDATATDSTYSSLPSTGYHRTAFQKQQKDALREYVACVNYLYESESFLLSSTLALYSFNKANKRRVLEYNKYQMYDGWYGNYSLAALYSNSHSRYYSELAIDKKGSIAALCGLVWSPSYNFEGALQLRYYPKDYIATHAGAYSSISNVSNQYGLLLNMLFRPFEKFTVTTMTDAAYHPHPRFRIDGPSTIIKIKARVEYAEDYMSFLLQDNYSYKSYEGSHKHSFRLCGKGLISESFEVGARADCVMVFNPVADMDAYSLELGWATSAYLQYYRQSGLKLAGGLAKYKSSSSSNKIYMYEKDLPQNFAMASYVGNGISSYILFSFRLFGDFLLSTKISANIQKMQSACLEARAQIDWQF